MISSHREFTTKVTQCGLISCILDALASPKPGNVHRFADSKDTTPFHFLISATSMMPNLSLICENGINFSNKIEKNIGLGVSILEAINAKKRWGIIPNTNLGIILLFMPLAAAAGAAFVVREKENYDDRVLMQNSVGKFLETSTPKDCINVVKAISTVAPAGLGKSEAFDINSETIEEDLIKEKTSLFSLFMPARKRDNIAFEYTSSFSRSITKLSPRFDEFIREGWDHEKAFIKLFLEILSKYNDSHISRTKGTEIAEEIKSKAGEILEQGGTDTEDGMRSLWSFDRELQKRKINPGTTADLTTSSVFCSGIISILNSGVWNLRFSAD